MCTWGSKSNTVLLNLSYLVLVFLFTTEMVIIVNTSFQIVLLYLSLFARHVEHFPHILNTPEKAESLNSDLTA